MTEILLKTLIDEDHATKILQAKVPDLQVVSLRLKYHPFAGFIFDVPTLAGRLGTTHALVDYYTGKAFISGKWAKETNKAVSGDAVVSDPGWNSITFEVARQKAKSLLLTASLRSLRLAWKGGIRETAHVEKVWKPNWILQVCIQGREYRVMVDGLNGGYFFIDA
ncbi:hypothetical protein [Glutamicibacter protophormiae]|uniref:hypothetical protein n=1 Tax=Glutamicibacter protophormiae TaxID=37930 RepID=UPI0033273E93